MKKTEKIKLNPKKIAIIAAVVSVVVIALFVAIVLILSANAYKAETSTVFVLDNGKVVTTDIEKFDVGKYDVNGLEAFLEETIRTYNEENGKDSVKQKEFSVEESVATLIVEYASADIYEDFYGIELFTGTISEAMKAGYAFDVEFARVVKEKAEKCDVEEITSQSDLKVAIIKANTRVEVDGKIKYVSADNISAFGKDWIVSKDNSNIFNKVEVDTQAGTEDVETTTEESTATEGEPVEGTEVSTEIIFDFGDEEVEESNKTEISEKYIYIIYE